jgi:hypothetical protein
MKIENTQKKIFYADEINMPINSQLRNEVIQLYRTVCI